jgi:membrane-associated phospholipid phosphatase
MTGRVAFIVVVLSVLASRSHADQTPAEPEDPAAGRPVPPGHVELVPELHVNRWLSGSLVVAGIGLWITADAVDSFTPRSCRLLCEPGTVNGFDSDLRQALRWDDPAVASHLSDVSAFVIAPLVGFGGLALAAWHDDRIGNWLDDGLVVAEAATAAIVFNKLIVLSFGRARPRTHYAAPDSPNLTSKDAFESFFSGHTTLAVGLTLSAAVVAQRRHYRAAPWLWGGAVAVSVFTGWMRIAADHHYATDVLTAMAVTSGFALAVPFFHATTRKPVEVSLVPLDDGGQLVLAGSW